MKSIRIFPGKLNTALLSFTLVSCLSYANSYQQETNYGLSTTVVAMHTETWNNAYNIEKADGKFASAHIQRGESSDTLKVTNFHFTLPENAVVRGVTINITRGAYQYGIYDKTIKLLINGKVCGIEHADKKMWSLTSTIQQYGSDTDSWGTQLTTSAINSYDFGLCVCAANDIYGIDTNIAYIDYASITISYSTPDTLNVNDFSGYSTDNYVQLGWTSIGCSNYTTFSIQRTTDGYKFETIGMVPNRITKNDSNTYSFTDTLPVSGNTYYRIVGVDKLGNTYNSNWIPVSTNTETNNMHIYSFPATSDKLTMQFPSLGQPVMVMVMNNSGKFMRSETISTTNISGNTSYVEDITDLPAGDYTLLVNDAGHNFSQNFEKN